ncbi:TLC domain-containing protein [Schizosaccharomyces pombe]|uniref:Uncharacterized TLC domain-containing protein C17A2.02c n=1 Tax=Schizosaccharomyces pombe (strain 972 / ATCC 24843) TaxID=284812 RepID=YF22_SCHPO|nr:uncharacterized protein SPAC17A2.02c [Schizosaccharomyces pombe]O13752.1 RecName: Full=Uncharacterized TLC domain-containing protein C17A2.02c [Schizosaccharomyces pombe 972h-]CAB16558.1 DUF887 family protein [Schizosaccharomyces pombe]|eukprot:NP_594236.1 uncharacterized protein SPAC17A2.02c [Schizosaccharomyces pombe]
MSSAVTPSDQGLLPRGPIALEEFVKPFCDRFGLTKLPRHMHVILLSALFYQIINILSPVISRHLSTHYAKLSKKTRLNWDAHVVSSVQSIVLICLGYTCLKEVNAFPDKLFGYSVVAGDIYALTAGYFVWDLYITVRYVHITGIGFVIHAIAALFVITFSYRPYLMYYGPTYLSWELSTPFLNIHYFLDKTNRTGSKFQMINGFILIVTFICVRIAWGWFSAYSTAIEILNHINVAPWALSLFYLAANMSLNCLNLFWVSKMIDAIRRRAHGEKKSTPLQVTSEYAKKNI